MEYEELFNRLDKAKPPLAILNHDNPDPDSMSCAYALGELSGKDYKIVTENGVSRPENQALVHYLGLDIENLDSEEFEERLEEEYGSISIVDSQFGNLPDGYKDVIEGKHLDKLISIQDHHLLEEKTEELEDNGIYVDVRPDIGSTATILTDCIDNSDFELNGLMATALYHGLYTDTEAMKKIPKDEDVKALSKLNNYIDSDKFGEITGEEYSSETLDNLGEVTRNREVRDTYLVSNAGIISSDNIDSISQSADLVSKQEGISVGVVSAIVRDNGRIQISIRAMGPKNNAADIAKRAYGGFPGSSAGGHKEAAGAGVPLGIFKYNLGDENYKDFVFENVDRAAWDALGKDQKE